MNNRPKRPALPELLAPAGDFSALRAAAGNGADAVYFGLPSFSARSQAANISLAELPLALDYLHERSMRGYLALNTLLSDAELQPATELACQAYAAGVDAVIVQDIGLAALLHQQLPDLPLHGSTQMTLTDEVSLKFAADLGLSRVILPRELNLQEITNLTTLAHALNIETEMFVHGALCISYSGQCLMSSLNGGRSGNRGLCAQPCRMEYQLLDEHKSFAAAARLSPRDQTLLKHLPDLVQTGVSSLKIEGRMRSAAYVAQVVAIYRQALNQLLTGIPDQESDPAQPMEELLLAFNRGGDFTDRYLTGNTRTPFMTGPYPGSYGIQVGKVLAVDPGRGLLRVMQSASTDHAPERGDVLSIRQISQASEIASAPIGSIQQQGRILEIKGFHPDVLKRIHENDSAFRMTHHRAELQALREDNRKTPISLTLEILNDRYVRLQAEVVSGQFAGMHSQTDGQISGSDRMPLPTERIRKQLAKAGGTPFTIVQMTITGQPACTIADLNEWRRSVLDLLTEKLHIRRSIPAALPAVQIFPEPISADHPAGPASADHPAEANADEHPVDRQDRQLLHAFFYRLPAASADLCCQADCYEIPLLSLNQESPVYLAEIRRREPTCRIMAWLPVVMIGETARKVREILSSEFVSGLDGLISGNPGADRIEERRNLAWAVETSANIMNSHSLALFLRRHPAAISLSAELRDEQIRQIIQTPELRKYWQSTSLLLPVYGRQRMMSSAYCPVGENKPGCKACHDTVTTAMANQSRPFWLQDGREQKYPLLSHPRVCTTDILSPYLLFAADSWQTFIRLGHSPDNAINLAYRLSFLDETPDERRQLIQAAADLIQQPDKNNSERLTACAGEIARRLNVLLKSGHYHQGVTP